MIVQKFDDIKLVGILEDSVLFSQQVEQDIAVDFVSNHIIIVGGFQFNRITLRLIENNIYVEETEMGRFEIDQPCFFWIGLDKFVRHMLYDRVFLVGFLAFLMKNNEIVCTDDLFFLKQEAFYDSDSSSVMNVFENVLFKKDDCFALNIHIIHEKDDCFALNIHIIHEKDDWYCVDCFFDTIESVAECVDGENSGADE
jgi:hypothetical protein